MYCAACPNDRLERTRGSTEVVDFLCRGCGAEYQVKAKSGSALELCPRKSMRRGFFVFSLDGRLGVEPLCDAIVSPPVDGPTDSGQACPGNFDVRKMQDKKLTR